MGVGQRKSLGDYTRMALAFYGCLLLIALYQQVRLYLDGVLDTPVSTSLALSFLHHLGFAALLAVVLAFAFNALESRKPGLGARSLFWFFLGLLGIEFLLTEYFTIQYELPGPGSMSRLSEGSGFFLLLRVFIGMGVLGVVFRKLQQRAGKVQAWIGKMYPLTIVLFSLFLATLLSDRRPVNQNKTEKILVSWFAGVETTRTPKEGGRNTYALPPVSLREKVWVHSVFWGHDFDRAYRIARKLAHEGHRKRAKQLTRYILTEVPGHVDAEILMARLLAWDGEYGKSSGLLRRVIQVHPGYKDGYEALLDTYFWAGEHQKALALRPLIEKHLGPVEGLLEKLERSKKAGAKPGLSRSSIQGETGGKFLAANKEKP